MSDQKTKALMRAEEYLNILESIQLRIQTKEQAANALLFSKKLREFADAIDERVRSRASEIMSDEEIKMIEVGNWTITRIEPSDNYEYQASSVIEALGIERATAFLRVNSGKVRTYIIKQGMTPEEIRKAQVGQKLKHRDGYIRIMERKNVKSDTNP
jgi:hypothetical protein